MSENIVGLARTLAVGSFPSSSDSGSWDPLLCLGWLNTTTRIGGKDAAAREAENDCGYDHYRDMQQYIVVVLWPNRIGSGRQFENPLTN